MIVSTKEVGLLINVNKTKVISHTRSARPRQNLVIEEDCIEAVSYTHLDVYKRQVHKGVYCY